MATPSDPASYDAREWPPFAVTVDLVVLTVRDGQILRYRDYWSPLAAATALGGLEELTSAFGSA